ncbi:MAG: STAS domain-containing protein [Gammaproteobacteria bacterium]|nr:STAS domain-containing protein [Gammaproteobacteria bacterium]MYD76710.1 STAS domain-containing protein [Gammaproteobacteria bacterium]MYJ51614.1 STAS domain-containing protein [Gammaproteobacteria bacterium]
MTRVKINNGTIALFGALTIDTVPELYASHTDFGDPIRTIDLKEIDDVDSSGLALLVYWRARLLKQPGFAGFENCPERLFDIAKLVGLEKIFTTDKSMCSTHFP